MLRSFIQPTRTIRIILNPQQDPNVLVSYRTNLTIQTTKQVEQINALYFLPR
jgi:hypothetical protein